MKILQAKSKGAGRGAWVAIIALFLAMRLVYDLGANWPETVSSFKEGYNAARNE